MKYSAVLSLVFWFGNDIYEEASLLPGMSSRARLARLMLLPRCWIIY